LSDEQNADEVESDLLHKQVGWVLRSGLTASVLLLAVGTAICLATGLEEAPAVTPGPLRGGAGLVLSTLGVLVLALTPAVRVLAVMVIWARERDWRFVGVALAVIATLAAGMAIGKG
jgi:uncharacterized membrane protein